MSFRRMIAREPRVIWKGRWRRSADRTRLHANSLLTGNFTGKIRYYGADGTYFNILWGIAARLANTHRRAFSRMRPQTPAPFPFGQQNKASDSLTLRSLKTSESKQ